MLTILFEQRCSDSPFIETVTQGYTPCAGSTIRPAECNWHMVVIRREGTAQLLVVGPLPKAGAVAWGEGAEILWIKFTLGAFMPHLPITHYLDQEAALPAATGQAFWLHGSTWQLPTFANTETFVAQLVREEILVLDPLVGAALQDQLLVTAPRTVRHHFLHATGLTQCTIRQMQRAHQAAALLRQGVSILDTTDALGYFDQPHLTRSLKQFVGHTPAQLLHHSQP
jgi:AraC-like DNA-binding protein